MTKEEYFNSGNQHMDEAEKYLNEDNSGKVKEAYLKSIEEYKKAIESDASSPYPEIWNNMGCAYSRVGQNDDAINCYIKAISDCEIMIKNNSQETISKYMLASSHYNLGNTYAFSKKFNKALESYITAISICEELIRLNSQEIQDSQKLMNNVIMNMGNVFKELEKYDKAIECYEKVIKYYEGELDVNSSNVDVLLNRANVLFNIGNVYEKQKKLDEAIDFYNKSIEYYIVIYKKTPDSVKSKIADAYNNKGMMYHWKNQFDLALECYNIALTYNDKHTKSLNNKAIILSKRKRYEEALENIDKILKLSPEDVGALHNKGTVLVEQNRYKEALEYFNKALLHCKNVGSKIKILNNIVSTLFRMNKITEAENYIDQVLTIEPNHLQALHNKGLMLDQRNDHDGAMYFYIKAIIIGNVYNSWTTIGLQILKNKYYDRAILCFDIALGIKDDYIPAILGKAEAYRYKKKYEKAIEFSNNALRIDPTSSPSWNMLGVIYFDNKEWNNALQYYEKAIKFDNQNAYAWHNKAEIYYFYNASSNGLECIDKAILLEEQNLMDSNIQGESNLLKAKILLLKGDLDNSVTTFEKAKYLIPLSIKVDLWRNYTKYINAYLERQNKYQDKMRENVKESIKCPLLRDKPLQMSLDKVKFQKVLMEIIWCLENKLKNIQNADGENIDSKTESDNKLSQDDISYIKYMLGISYFELGDNWLAINNLNGSIDILNSLKKKQYINNQKQDNMISQIKHRKDILGKIWSFYCKPSWWAWWLCAPKYLKPCWKRSIFVIIFITSILFFFIPMLLPYSLNFVDLLFCICPTLKIDISYFNIDWHIYTLLVGLLLFVLLSPVLTRFKFKDFDVELQIPPNIPELLPPPPSKLISDTLDLLLKQSENIQQDSEKLK